MKKLLWTFTLGIIILAGCGKAAEEEQEAGKTVLHFSENAELLTLDTTQEEDFVSFNAQNQVLEGLYQLDEQDRVIPAVAQALPTISEDQQTYTIKLRESAKWSNGEPVTADDFIYAWRRAVAPETAPSYASLFVASIENAAAIYEGQLEPAALGVEAPDQQTLVIHLIKPIGYFTSLLTFETFFPINEAFAVEKGAAYGTSSENTLYNGPFVLSGWEANRPDWRYLKNADYWDAQHVQVDEIKISVVKSTSTAVNMYQAGELDRVILDGEFAKQLANDPDFYTQNDTKIGYLRFNQEPNKALHNKNLRKALALAIDRQAYVDHVLQDGSLAAAGFIPRGFVFEPESQADFREVSGALQVFDVSAAQTAWQQAQSELGKPEISLDYLTSDTDTEKLTAEFIAGQLQELLPGVTINIVSLPTNNLQERYLAGEYDLAFGQWMPDYQDPSTYLDMFQSNDGLNHIHYASEAYDRLIDNAENLHAGDATASWQDFVAAEQLLVGTDYAIAPIYQRQTALLQKKNIANVVKHAFGSPYSFKYIQVEAAD